jgi:hypothetical protein
MEQLKLSMKTKPLGLFVAAATLLFCAAAHPDSGAELPKGSKTISPSPTVTLARTDTAKDGLAIEFTSRVSGTSTRLFDRTAAGVAVHYFWDGQTKRLWVATPNTLCYFTEGGSSDSFRLTTGVLKRQSPEAFEQYVLKHLSVPKGT